MPASAPSGSPEVLLGVRRGSSRCPGFYHALVTPRCLVPLVAAIALTGTACAAGATASFSSPAIRVTPAALLPTDLPKRMKGVDVAARFAPARELGGDLYDFLAPEPNSLVIAVGDVSGKGVPAALYGGQRRRGLGRN